MLKSLFSKHGSLARGIVMAVLSMSLAMPVGVAVQAEEGSGDTTYISDTNTEVQNIQALDKQVVKNAQDIANNKTSIDTNTTNIGTNQSNIEGNKTAIGENKTAIDKNTASIATNTSNIAANTTAISKEITARTKAISDLETKLTTGDNSLASKANVNASNIGKNITTGATDDEKKKKQEENATLWGKALGLGAIENGDSMLISGGTLYSELRPSDGTYVKSAKTTADNLLALDKNLKNVIDAIGLDADDTTTSYTSKLNKYFKVNPEVTTSADGKTYAADAAANGTNSVAIGPSAQAGDKSTDATTSTTTITGGTSSTAIGDSAKANGNQSVALGYGSEVLNASGSTTAVSGSTAIGSGAKVEGGSDSTALGSGATVDTASNAMALGKSATINKTSTSGVAIGNGAVTGSADKTITVNNLSYAVKAAGGENSVAIGTDASSAGNTSLALGKGATVENDSDGNYQAVVKSNDIAIGTDAKTSASDSSTAIGKGASVAQSTDALAIGSSAAVGASSNDAMALGKGAAVGSGAADSIAMGTKAKTISADTIAIGQNTSAEGANSVVIGKGAATTDEGGNAIGTGSAASGSSTAIGQSAQAINYNALAIGNNATANADKSISLGYKAGVGTSEGRGETQNAGSLIAIGTSAGNNVSGMQNVAIGESAGSNVKSSNNIAIGTQAGYGINYASDNKTQNGYNVSIGYKANYQENAASIMYATALGNEANASNYAVAIGDGAKASGTNSLALGYSAQASDEESMALGHNASAADGNVAIGNGSLAPAVSSLGTVKDGYVYQSTTSTDSTGASTTTLTELKSAFTYKPLASDSHYISVGTTDLTRRISNVADGVFASDAATVGQLNSLNELLQATDTKVGLTTAYFDQKFTNLNTTIDASKTHYFSISESSDNLSANKDNTGATSNKADAMAIGPNANATNVKSLAVGNNVYATGLRSIAIGTAPNPTKDAAGTTTTHNTSAEGENSIALGTSTTAQADNSVAIGTRAQAYTTDTDSGKTGARSVAIGNLATTAGNQSVALGYDATVKYDYGTAIGSEALASGTDAVAVGKGSKAYSTDSTAIGQDNTVTGSNVYGLGSSNALSGNWGSIVQSGVSGYQNTVTSVSDQDTTNALTGVYITGSSNTLNQNVKYNVMQDITVQGSSNTIDGGAGGTSGHPNTLSQIAIVGSDNTVQGKSSDDSKTNNIENVTILGYNNKVDANTDTTVDFSNTQILGNNVTATLGNSVYLGNKAAYVQPTSPASDAITAARTAADTAAEASDEYKAAATDEAKVQIKAEYEAKYLYKLRVQAIEGNGTTAGMNSYDTDETYGNGTSYTYAGSNPTGVITVGSVGSEHRIQNVAAGLVSATSTDAVNGSQLYALTRQIRFGGDNSSFGTTTADDKNVVARGSNETLNIIGGEKDTTKLTDNNIGVLADSTNNTLTVKLASNLKDLNTAQLGSGSGDSYKGTIKLDGTGTTGGQMTLAGADGTVKTTLDTTGLTVANGPKFTSSGIDAASKKINHVTAGTDDADAANVGQVNAAAAEATTEVKAGNNASLGTVETSAADKHKIYTVNVDNLAVKANGTNTATVTMDNGINFKNGTNTTATVGTDGTVTISASHNKLDSASYTASKPSDSSNQTTVKLKDTDNNETTLNLTDTYTNVSKNTDHTITFKRNDGSTPVSISLDDLNGASKKALTTAAAKATTTVIQGNNVDRVEDDTTSADGHHIYKINVSNLGVKVADGQKKSVALSEGLVFGNGTNTTASVGDNGAITFNVSDAAIKTQAKDALDVVKGNDNVSVDTTTSPDGTKKTFTISAKDTYTTVTKDADHKTVTFTRNDGDSQTVSLSDLGGITAAQDKYVTGGKVTYNDKGDGTAALTGNNGLAASITGLKDTKVSSGTASYVGTQGDASGSATLKMNDGTTATISDLKDDYITSASVGTENNHVTMTRLGGGTVELDLNPILGKYSLSDYHLVGSGTTEDQPYTVSPDGTVTLNVVDSKNAANKKTIQITGLASQSGVNAGRTTVKSSDSSVIVNDGMSNSNTHTYDIKVDYSKIPANLTVQYSGDNGTTGSNTMDKATAFSGKANQIVTTAENGKVSFKLADNISGIQSVTTGDAKLNTDGLTITGGPSVLKTGINAGGKIISNVADAAQDTDAATLKQVKNARTVVVKGDNVKEVTSSEATDGSHQMAYTVNVDNLSVKANNEAAKSVTLKNGLTFNNGTNTTASVGSNGEVKYDLNSTLTGLTSVTAGNSTLDTNGLTIKEGTAPKVVITSGNVTMGGNVIHNVGDGVAPTDAVNKGQLDALQTQVSGGWNLSGKNSDGTAVTAKIGAGKTVTYADGTYTKSVITKDDTTGNAAVKVDVTTGTFGSGIGDNAGTVTSTANGLATTQDVAGAINSASINVVADNTPDNKTSVKAGDTIHFAKDGNLTLVQNGTTFTYGLNPEINISKVTTSDATKGSTVQTAEGVTTTDAAGNTYIQNGQGITLTPKTPEAGKTAVILSNKGLNNGGNVISGVGAGTADTDAVNMSQLKRVQDQVGSGWQIAGNDGTKVADIGAGKKVAFKSNSKYLTTSTARSATGDSDTGADVTYNLKTKALASGTNGTVASVSDADDGLATAKNVAETINQTYWTAASGKSGSGSQTDETANAADKQISAGDTVIFNAGNNLSLVQNGASFTYGLQTDLTGMNTIRFGGTLNNGNWSGGLLIGKQAGFGANTADGNYITGLSNTKWDRATISENSSMAATEGQLKQAIENITTSGGGTGGFGLQADTGDSIMQDLRKTIQIKGDGEGSQDGNIKTSNEGGVLRIRLNKTLNLSEDGSVQVGSSKMSNGAIQLGEDADANKILMDSAKGMVTVGGVTINGANKTVSGLSNTTWEVAKATQDVSVGGYKGSTNAATESQLAAAISEATTTAAQNEQHIQAGNYEVGKGTTLDGKAIGKNSVAINVISGDGTKPGDVKGQVVINDVAKASDVGDTDKLSTEVKTKNGGNDQKTSVVEAVNNLNDKVNNRVGDNRYSAVTSKDSVQDGDSSTTAIAKLNNRMTDIYTTSTQHSSVSVDGNLTLDSSRKNTSGGTNYQIGLNKEKIDLGKVTIQGNEGSIEAKSMKADSFTAGDTVVNKDGVKVGDKSALTGDSLKVGGKTYVDDKGINANGKAIGNVGDGKKDTDAVNVKQLNKQLNDVKSDYKAADTELAKAIQQTDAGLNEVGRAVNKLGNRLNRVGAGAAALAALHPGTYDPNDKWDFSAGIGHYHDANAVAIGAYYHPNDTTILSIGGSMGGGENMVNAGITWKMGRSGHEQRAAQPVVTHPVQAAPAVQQAAPVRPAPVTTPTPVVTPAPVTTPVPVKAVVPAMPAPAVTTAMPAAPAGDTAALTQILARQTAILEKLAQNQSQAARPTAV
ncbi:YadA-like family protein, partial [Megasphaera elsdenii]|uniref:YadA-like family protein n=1 Tax=Megasphaera elsdenii TaxID=907 RepID=UPI0024307C6A